MHTHDARDVWQCHNFAAKRTGCVAVPLFSRRNRGMCGSATFPVQKTPYVWQCHGSRAGWSPQTWDVWQCHVFRALDERD